MHQISRGDPGSASETVGCLDQWLWLPERGAQGAEVAFEFPPAAYRGGIERLAHLPLARRLHDTTGLVEGEAFLPPIET